MHASILILVTIVSLIETHDVAIGLNNYGKKIFAENRQASPAIWRQKENVTIEAAENEVITKVIIIDMRPEKDGDASIVDGGEGKKNVTIELKSPTVLRGYDFHIEVFSAPDLSNNSNASESSDSGSSILSTPDLNQQTNTKTRMPKRITSSDEPSTINENKDIIRPVQATYEGRGDTNIEGSTLHTSVLTYSVTTNPNNADDKVSTLTNDMTANSNVATTDMSDNLNKNSNDVTTLKNLESNDTVPEDLGDEFKTTLSDSTTEITTELNANQFINGKDVLDFPDLTGLNDDDSRHARETKQEEISTMSDMTTEVTTELTTLMPESSTNSEIPDITTLSYKDGKDVRHPRRTNDDEISDTISHLDEETNTTELITILSPESDNEKTTIDFAAISGLEKVEPNEGDILSTESTTTEIATEISTTEYTNSDLPQLPLNINYEDEMRQARAAKDDSSLNDVPKSVEPSTNSSNSEDNDNGDDEDINISESGEVSGQEDDTTTTEASISQADTTQTIPNALFNQESGSINPLNSTGIFYNPLNILNDMNNKNESMTTQDTSTPMMSSQPGLNNGGDQVSRNSRDAVSFNDIFGNNYATDPSVPPANYPIFVNPSNDENEYVNNSDEYVYVPLIAIINKSSYSTFQDALQSLIQQSKMVIQAPN